MVKEINESYEEQVLKEFEDSQTPNEPKTITNLGNINDNNVNLILLSFFI